MFGENELEESFWNSITTLSSAKI